MKKLSVLCVVLVIASCATKKESSITGKWLMHKVIQDGKDVSAEHNPHGERFLVMHADSTFESGGRPYGTNAGKYVYNPTSGTLFIDSDVGPDDDSNWKVSLSNDTMYWQGIGNAWADRFQIVHVRSK